MKLLLKRLLSYLPSRLPVGMSEFDTWSSAIIALTGPIADNDSLRFALASQIMHQGAAKGSIPKSFFVNSLRKAAANQVASQVFQDIKIKQQDAQKAALEAAQPTAEVTATQEAVVESVKA